MPNDDVISAWAALGIISAMVGYCCYALYIPLIAAFPFYGNQILIVLGICAIIVGVIFFRYSYKAFLRYFN